MTSATAQHAKRPAERPGYRPFVTTVAAVTQLSPHYVRVTLRGETLADFAPHGLDQRIKLVLPFDDGSITDVGFTDETVLAEGSWYTRWRALPDARRNPVRTYTVRAIRPERREIDVDVVRHPAAPGTRLGPAARWIARVRVGDPLVVAGPDVRSPQSRGGIDWQPGEATRLLIVGDETAVPAALSILERLPHRVEVDALLEVRERADILPVQTRARARVTWLDREVMGDEAAPGAGDRLVAALERWVADNPAAYADSLTGAGQARPSTRATATTASTDDDADPVWDSPGVAEHRTFYAWLAGEQSAIKRMRRHLVTVTGIDRTAVAFMGYWRLGKSEAS